MNIYKILTILIIFSPLIFLIFINEQSIFPDEALYSWYAKKFSESPTSIFSKELTEYTSYTNTIAAGSINIILKDPLKSSKIITIISSILFLLNSFLVGKEIKDKKTGLIFSFLIITNGVFISLLPRALTDITFLAVFTGIFYFLIKYEKTGNKNFLYFFILSSIVLFYTKAISLILFPILLIYIILNKESRLRNKKASKNLSYILLGLIPLIIIKSFHYGWLTLLTSSELTKIPGREILIAIFSGHWWYYIVTIPVMLGIFMLPFMCIGFLKFKRKNSYFLLLSWLLTFFIFFSFLSPFKIERYGLYILVPLLLISSIGLIHVYKKLSTKKIAFIFVLAVLIGNGILGVEYGKSIINDNRNYAKELIIIPDYIDLESSSIYTTSIRQVRLITGIEYQEFGGTLKPFPLTQEPFDLNNTKYLIIDSYDVIRPEWVNLNNLVNIIKNYKIIYHSKNLIIIKIVQKS